MKYQIVGYRYPKDRFFDTLKEADAEMQKSGMTFVGRSYVGGFPQYEKNGRVYQIQGLIEKINIVCSFKWSPEDLKE